MIKIYTYADPYRIDKERFWPEIENAPQYCVSQTMVNGMECTYPHFKDQQQLTTIKNLLNALYSDWEDLNTRMRQMMEVDTAIHEITGQNETVQRSLAYNEASLVDCIRLFQELGLENIPFTTQDLNIDQQYLADIYAQILKRDETAFAFSHVKNEQEIQAALEAALMKRRKHDKLNFAGLQTTTVVLHGIHQFSPAMLCAIEDISRYCTVILLFNYQEQYKAIYQTWINIYSLFEQPIQTDSTNQRRPVPLMVDSFESILLADRIGKLAEGQYDAQQYQDIEVIEFANMTEFAGYAAALFERANENLSQMREQLYSASGKVNDILRAYFPEQFGERHFLDYPIGHFFVASANMWDPDTQRVKVDSLSDVKECLECGIITEERRGQHINSLNQIIPFIEKEATLEGVIKRLKRLKKYVNRGTTDVNIKRVGYMAITKEDLAALIHALEELNTIVCSFFEDFEEGGDNFRRFYQRIQSFIVKRIANLDDLDDEMRIVINKLLERMQKSDLPDTGTYVCLRQTMSYYLSQDDHLEKGAHWIVRDFEQIDGDILRSLEQNRKADKTCYHFCCLSDKDICASKDTRLPWPLDIHFFEYACEPLDWKYQIFLKSKMEYQNFKKYALLYGLEFNRIGFKLSYVKTEHEKENDVFHYLALLGAKITPYREYRSRTPVQTLQYQVNRPVPTPQFDEIDRIKWAMCPYRFAMERLVQEETVFRDRFLILNYMRALLINRVRDQLVGEQCRRPIIQKALELQYQRLSDQFHILNELEKTQLIHESYKEIIGDVSKNKWSVFPPLNQSYRYGMKKREIFLRVISNDYIEKQIHREVPSSNALLESLENESEYAPITGAYCTMCASKDVCLKRLKET